MVFYNISTVKYTILFKTVVETYFTIHADSHCVLHKQFCAKSGTKCETNKQEFIGADWRVFVSLTTASSLKITSEHTG